MDAVARFARCAAMALAAVCLVVPSAPQAQPKGDITIAATILRQNFNPVATQAVADSMTFSFMFDGLINLRANGKQPALATAWTISEDGKQVDFTLRQNVKFHNGDSFSAEDVKFTFEALMKQEAGHVYGKAYQENLERVDIIGPYQARFVLKQPWPAFFTASRYALQAIVPKAYYEKVGAKGFQEKPVGTGPYVLSGLKVGESNTFDAFPGYWGQVSSVHTIKLQLVKEAFTRFAMLQKGEADIAMGLTGPLMARVGADSRFRIFLSKYSGSSALFFHRTDFPLSRDKRLRMAVAHAIDREGIAKTILAGICEPGTSMFTPATFGFLPGLKQVPYDVTKAKELVKEAGGPGNQEVTFLLISEAPGSLPSAPQVMEAVAGAVEGLGFKIKRIPVEMGAYVATFRQKQEPNVFSGLAAIPDDGEQIINDWYTSWAVWAHGNAMRPEYESIYQEQRLVPDQSKREKLLQKFAQIEGEEYESIPLFWCGTPFAAGPRIKDWKPAIGTPYQLELNTVVLAN